MNKHLVVLSGLFILLFACDDKNTGSPKNQYSYPMTIGSEWTYHREMVIKMYESENSDIFVDSTTYNFMAKVWVEKDTVLNDTMNVTIFKSSDLENNWISEQYMFIDSDGLKCYGYSNANGIYTAKKRELQKMLFYVFLNSNIPTTIKKNDILIYENPPTLNIKYPLRMNLEWTYRYPSEYLFLQINKKVIKLETLTLIGQSFDCYKIEYKYMYNPIFDGIEITDWIAKKGLIKRQIIADRIASINQYGDTIGEYKNIETIIISDLDLKY